MRDRLMLNDEDSVEYREFVLRQIDTQLKKALSLKATLGRIKKGLKKALSLENRSHLLELREKTRRDLDIVARDLMRLRGT